MLNSSFDVTQQNQHIESKIVVALERISEAFRVLLWNESKENALSPIQIQILIFLLFHAKEKSKVSYLAQEFNMTKATISDSVKALMQKGLIEKFDDVIDTRSYTIGLTTTGKQTAEKSAGFALAIEKPLHTLTDEQKGVMLSALLKLMYELNQAGIISVQRMCFNCANYRYQAGIHFCTLLQSELTTHTLRIDCPEHQTLE